MQGLSDVQVFLRSREAMGEKIVFLLDAAQAVDKRRRKDDDVSLQSTRSWMVQILRNRRVIWVLSPADERMVEFEEKIRDDTRVIHLDTSFVGDGMDGFTSHGILGLLMEKRGKDISHYAGKHPLFLCALEECCKTVAAAKMHIKHEDVQREGAANLFREDEDWKDVINEFVDHKCIASIQVDIDRHLKLEEGETYHTVEKMISCDPQYALTKNQFCSPFVERMYIEAFLAKERAASVTDCSLWVAYGEMLLSQPFMNWSELGWLCERLYGDVVSRLGIDIGANLSIGKLTLKRIRKVPRVELGLVPGCGILYLPVTFSFGHVDAIIIYRDVDGKWHFIGLRITTSLKQHVDSENEFMSYEVLKEWNVLDGVWNLHYAFVCLTEREWSEEKKANLTQLQHDVVVGIVAHSLHVITFETALGNRVGKRTLEVFKKMTGLRDGNWMRLPGI
ncbi:hypothetical protein GOP47_0027895 [Adiantum capillus-veneris]|nr:hypothetical protein GOP47_0027895 [Adiantum capillus-veneris]